MITAALTIPFVVGLALLFLRKLVSGRTAAWLGAVAMAASLVLFGIFILEQIVIQLFMGYGYHGRMFW